MRSAPTSPFTSALCAMRTTLARSGWSMTRNSSNVATCHAAAPGNMNPPPHHLHLTHPHSRGCHYPPRDPRSPSQGLSLPRQGLPRPHSKHLWLSHSLNHIRNEKNERLLGTFQKLKMVLISVHSLVLTNYTRLTLKENDT